MSGPPSVSVIVRWHSALPIKQAVARARFGDALAGDVLGQQRRRGLAQRATAHVMPDIRNTVSGEFEVERHPVAAERVVERHGLVGGVHPPGAIHGLGSVENRLLIKIVAHRSRAAALSRPMSSASMSVSVL